MSNEKQFIIQDSPSIIPYQELTYTIGAGASVDVFAVFSYFRVLALSGSGLSLKFGQNGMVTPFTGQGLGINIGLYYSRLTLFNTSGSSMTVTIALAIGTVNDDRLTVSTSLTTKEVVTTIATIADATVTTTRSIIVPADSTRNEAFITNMDAAITMYIGDVNVTNTTRRGVPLLPGQTLIVKNQANIYAISASGSPVASLAVTRF